MERPRLLIAVTSPMSSLFFQGQLAWLREQGFEVHFLCSPGQPAEDIVASQCVNFHPVPMERGISPWRDLRALWRVIGVLRRVRPQIVNAGTPKAGMLVMLASWFCAVPTRIYTIHGLRFETVNGPLGWLLFILEKFSCTMATHVVCVGPGLHSLVRQYRLCSENKTRVLVDLNAIPASKQSSQDVRGRAHDLLWMASLAARRAGKTSTVRFQVIMHLGRTGRQTYKLMIHLGDHGEPVVTILRPNED